MLAVGIEDLLRDVRKVIVGEHRLVKPFLTLYKYPYSRETSSNSYDAVNLMVYAKHA